MALDSMKEIFDQMERENIPFWEVVLQADMEERQVTRKQSMAKMLITWQAMEDAADTYTGTRKSVSGLVGGDGIKIRHARRRHVRRLCMRCYSGGSQHGGVKRMHAAHSGGAYCGSLWSAAGGAAAHLQL